MHGLWERLLLALVTVALVGGTAYAVLLGCGGGQPAPRPKAPAWRTVDSGTIATPGVQIAADGGTPFRLVSGEPFRTPWSSSCWGTRTQPSVSKWKVALSEGARRVIVTVDGRQRPLYGVLQFCKVPTRDSSAAARSYRIRLDPKILAQTAGQRMVLVGEITPAAWITDKQRRRFKAAGVKAAATVKGDTADKRMFAALSDPGMQNFTKGAATWLLWLSEAPLP